MALKTDVLIVGGGLAGLSTAYHLGSRLEALVVEKGTRVGGTAGSVAQDGFTFDQTGHLLHLHDDYGRRLILGLLRGNAARHERSAWIHSRGVDTRYPFQANTFGLPPRVVDDCLLGFLKTVHRPGRPLGSRPSFRDWCLRQFGEGISRHFMFPYNEKLWKTPLEELTTEWQGRFVPKPKPGEVLRGALMDQRKAFGYNASFYYPRRGGCQALPDALAARLRSGQVRLRCALKSVDLRERIAVVEGLGEVAYGRLVNTMPLYDFLGLVGPLPARADEARRRLRFNTVWNLNLGVARAGVCDKHWIYFPEKSFPFYRVGFASNFARSNHPRGTSSLYIEVSRKPQERVDKRRLETSILDGLRRCGLLKASDRLVTRQWNQIRCGYVVYDFERTPAVAALTAFLNRRGVDSIGRYGGWKYSFMEETILDGKACAERLCASLV